MKAKTVKEPVFQPNEPVRTFQLEDDKIQLEVENSMRGLYWRMTVNGSPSEVTGYYQGILVHKGYALVTAYFAGPLPEFVPFKVTTAKEIT